MSMNKKILKIYVAGPYAHPDPVVNTRNAILAGEEIVKKGHIPFIPHLSMLWHTVVPHEADFWYEYDLQWLPDCHALLRLPGHSLGADREVREADRLGLHIYWSTDEVPNVK